MNLIHKYRWLSCGIIALACSVVYFPILGNDFLTDWDDGWQVMNEYTETWSWQNIWYILTEYYYGQYSPANQLLYTSVYHFVGYHPAWFHLVSLLLHTCNALLVYVITLRLLQVNLTKGHEVKIAGIALGVSLMFAVHPLQVESVAWVSASKVLVYSLFYLLAVWCYLGYLQKGKGGWYFAMLACFILSFGGKEQAVTLPVCLLWIDLVYRRNFGDSKLWYEKLPVLLLTIIFVYTTFESHASSNTGILSQEQTYPFIQRVVFGSYAFCEYIVKTVFPVKLLYVYPFPMRIGEQLPYWFWMYPILLLIVAICFRKFWLQRVVGLPMLWFVIHIGLMLHIIPMSRFAIVADRYIYLAIPGLLFVIAWYIYAAYDRWLHYRRWIACACILWLLVLGISTHQRTKVWHDNVSLKKELRDLFDQRLQLQTDQQR